MLISRLSSESSPAEEPLVGLLCVCGIVNEIDQTRVSSPNDGECTALGGWLSGKLAERFSCDRCWMYLTVEMPAGISDGMWMLVTRNVAVGRESTHAGNSGRPLSGPTSVVNSPSRRRTRR